MSSGNCEPRRPYVIEMPWGGERLRAVIVKTREDRRDRAKVDWTVFRLMRDAGLLNQGEKR